MARNKEFKTKPAPLINQSEVQLRPETVDGPLPFFNPTRARYAILPQTSSTDGQVQAPEAEYQWRTRDNRKGRHALVTTKNPSSATPRSTATTRPVLHGLKRMITFYPYWDVSYLVAVSFTFGCLIFVACGLFYWLPIAYPSTEFSGEEYWGGWTSLVGGVLFQAGAILLVFEASNENQTGCFGFALKQAITRQSHSDQEAATTLLVQTNPGNCQHHHARRQKGTNLSKSQQQRTWEWWPRWQEIKTHYIYEMGWVASMTMFIGATVFFIPALTALPNIFSHMSLGLRQGLYWFCYLLGGVLFIVSSAFYMLETQIKWYKPAWHVLGWWIGLFNMIGSIGWTMSASFGYCTAGWCEYQGELTLIWASAAFTIGSALLWYEALSKYPVETQL